MRKAGTLVATIVALALILLAPTARGKSEDPPRQYAVVVGINDYDSPQVNPLRYAVADAKALAATLRDLGYKVFSLTSDRDGEEAPTRTNIIFRLGWMRDHLRPQDSLIFFFSGHGMEEDHETFLLTRESDPRSLDTLKASACPPDRVKEILDKVKANRILVVYDACRSNPKADKGGSDNRMSEHLSRDLVLGPRGAAHAPVVEEPMRATLFACSEGQRSYEWADKKHGYFTYFLIQGLRGKAGANGKVTLDKLERWVREKVNEATVDAGQEQKPLLRFEGGGMEKWVLSTGAVAAAPREEDNEPAVAPAPRKPRVRTQTDEEPAPRPRPSPQVTTPVETPTEEEPAPSPSPTWTPSASPTTRRPSASPTARRPSTSPTARRPSTHPTLRPVTQPSARVAMGVDSRVLGIWSTPVNGHTLFAQLTGDGSFKYALEDDVIFAVGAFRTYSNGTYEVVVTNALQTSFVQPGYTEHGTYVVSGRLLKVSPVGSPPVVWTRIR